ncbi:MAG: hypothetical protein Q4G33_03750 [bacterium]|nr:hypothetical protein [bacterium]
MKRNEFLKELYRESGFMLPEDRRTAVNYFRDRFVPGDDEEAVCAELGEPGAALKRYLLKKRAGRYGRIKKLLMCGAALLASPAVIYAAAAVLLILLAVIIAVLLIFAAFPLAGAELWLSGIDSFIRLMPENAGLADRLCIIGSGLLLSGIGIFIMLGVYKLYRKLIPWIIGELASSYRRIRARLRRRVQ